MGRLIVISDDAIKALALVIVIPILFFLAIRSPLLAVTLLMILVPTLTYIRDLFPVTINIGGLRFYLLGAIKDILEIFLLVGVIVRGVIFKRKLISKDIVYIYFLIFIAFSLLRSFPLQNHVYAFSTVRVYIMCAILYYIGRELGSNLRFIRRIYFTLIVVCISVTLFGIYSFLFKPEFLHTSRFNIEKSAFRMGGILAENALGDLEMVIVILVFNFILMDYLKGKRKLKLWYIFLLSIPTISLIATQSRGAFLSFLIGVFMIVIFYKKFINLHKALRWIVFLIIIFFLSIYLFPTITVFKGVTFLQPQYMLHRFGSTFTWESIFPRFRSWCSIYNAFRMEGILTAMVGFGPGQIGGNIMGDLNEDITARYGIVGIDSAYGDIIINFGLIGIGILFCIFYRIIKRGLILPRIENKELRGLLIGIYVVIICLMISSVYHMASMNFPFNVIFWIFAGVFSAVFASDKTTEYGN
jgi:hypothetical protein